MSTENVIKAAMNRKIIISLIELIYIRKNMKKNFKSISLIGCLMLASLPDLSAQSYNWVSSTQSSVWKQSTVKLQNKAAVNPALEINGNESLSTFKAWGATFNELGWDALNVLSPEQRETILKQYFSPEGDMRFTLGRFSMNANDYSRSWYSCDEVAGDFKLTHFNIDRDKTTLIPYIKAVQKYNPNLRFWISPWSPPSWMKVNQHYAVRSDKRYNDMSPSSDVVLSENQGERNGALFPRELALNDYLIQDPRYLKTYANLFCKFISAYKEEGIPISMVMYQNEAWSYTVYPGCAWTPEGVIRFNAEYLAPALKEQHPNVSLYMGTFNTNRYDVVDQILSDPRMPQTIKGVGFQWEGGQLVSRIKEKYPQYKYVQTESECGRGSFDWKAGEHTFGLINHYLGNGCEEYTFWNIILCNNGESPWGWKQNAHIRVDSKTGTATYTPEYYAVKHYAHFVMPESHLLAYRAAKEDRTPVLVFLTPQKKYVIVAGNFNEVSRKVTIKLNGKYLNVILEPHSMHSFQLK